MGNTQCKPEKIVEMPYGEWSTCANFDSNCKGTHYRHRQLLNSCGFCPEDYPYSFNDGKGCCKYNVQYQNKVMDTASTSTTDVLLTYSSTGPEEAEWTVCNNADENGLSSPSSSSPSSPSPSSPSPSSPSPSSETSFLPCSVPDNGCANYADYYVMSFCMQEGNSSCSYLKDAQDAAAEQKQIQDADFNMQGNTYADAPVPKEGEEGEEGEGGDSAVSTTKTTDLNAALGIKATDNEMYENGIRDGPEANSYYAVASKHQQTFEEEAKAMDEAKAAQQTAVVEPTGDVDVTPSLPTALNESDLTTPTTVEEPTTLLVSSSGFAPFPMSGGGKEVTMCLLASYTLWRVVRRAF